MAEIRIIDVFDAVSPGQAYEPRPNTESLRNRAFVVKFNRLFRL